jgi:hypothetical protein
MAQFISFFKFLEFLELVGLFDFEGLFVTTEGFDSVERDLELFSNFRKFHESIILVSFSAQETRAHDRLL